MLPQILSCPDRTQCDTIIGKFIMENAVLQHDIYRVKRLEKKKELAVDQIRELLPLFHHHYTNTRVIVIEDYDTASEEAQNALLKILEEKTEKTQFFLIVMNAYKVLPTIRSRSQVITIASAGLEEKNDQVAVLAENILNGSISSLSSQLVANINAEKAIALCDALLLEIRLKLTSSGKQTTNLMKEIMRIKKLLQDNNLNPQLGIDYLILAQQSR